VNTRRVASIGSALVVAGIAAYASYSHMRHLALAYGQDATVATLLPISVDGLMVVATIALGDGRRYRWSAWLAFWAGVSASVIANVLAAEPSGVARTISAWPAIAFLLVVEVITRGGRLRVSADSTPATEADTVDDMPTDPWATYSTPLTATPPAIEADTKPAPKRTPARTVKATKAATDTATKVAKLAAKTPDITPATIATKLDISERTARRHLSAIRTDTEPDSTPVNGHPVPELVTTSGSQS
jgi:DNA-binding CsgD family transcriptional regulator